jgi:hypothetical protein
MDSNHLVDLGLGLSLRFGYFFFSKYERKVKGAQGNKLVRTGSLAVLDR